MVGACKLDEDEDGETDSDALALEFEFVGNSDPPRLDHLHHVLQLDVPALDGIFNNDQAPVPFFLLR